MNAMIGLIILPLMSLAATEGGTVDFRTSNLWLIKTDSLGDTLWTKTYGGAFYDAGLAVSATSDAGYIAAGLREPTLGDYGKIWLVKTDSLGDTLWTRTYGSFFCELSFHLEQTEDGGYLVVGKRYPAFAPEFNIDHIWILKTDSLGDSLWMRSYGKRRYLNANDICKTSDGGYVIIGGNGKRLWMMKIDADGGILWERTYGWPNQSRGHQISKTGEEGYSIIARKGSKFWRLYTDLEGHIVASRTYDVVNLKKLKCVIKPTSDSGYVLVTSEKFPDLPHYPYCDYLVKLGSEGEVVWRKLICHRTCIYLEGTDDGGCILAGHTDLNRPTKRDVWLLRVDSEGNTMWEHSWNGENGDYAEGLQRTSDGGYIIVCCRNEAY